MYAFVGIPFEQIHSRLREMIVEYAADVDVGEWHAADVKGMPALVSRELLNISIELEVPKDINLWQQFISPNLPWAEDHFWERVCGKPLNPGEEYQNWPWAGDYFDSHLLKFGRFSHTYMERFWPKHASDYARIDAFTNYGIRFSYGDLADVVMMLLKNPLSRQAYLPIFFPEDTGAVHEERIPCTLGYHFIIRNNKINCVYYLRSCDFVRYFRDDIYLAGRLLQWVWEKVRAKHKDLDVGRLVTHVTSLHVMQGDLAKLRREVERATHEGS
jgi:Thymidylate synthase